MKLVFKRERQYAWNYCLKARGNVDGTLGFQYWQGGDECFQSLEILI